MKIDLTNKTALICASSKGIGFSCAENIAKSGGRVIINSRNEENLLEAKDKIIESCKSLDRKPEIKLLKGDLENLDQLPELVKGLQNEFSIDMLILNSGGPKPGGFLDYENPIEFNEDANKIIEPSILLMNYLLPNMIKNNFGRIINISSVSGLMGNPGQVNYASSKAALTGFTKSLAKELAPEIRVNAISPGAILWPEDEDLSEEQQKTRLAKVPLGRIGHPKDISSLAVFLSDAEYITGQVIKVDGGRSIS